MENQQTIYLREMASRTVRGLRCGMVHDTVSLSALAVGVEGMPRPVARSPDRNTVGDI